MEDGIWLRLSPVFVYWEVRGGADVGRVIGWFEGMKVWVVGGVGGVYIVVEVGRV